jgi:hypothetical protein
MHLLIFLCLRLSDTEIFMSAVRRRRPYGQVGVITDRLSMPLNGGGEFTCILIS